MTGGVSPATATATARKLKTINPATEEVINIYKIMTKEPIHEKVKKAYGRTRDEPFPICMKVQTFRQRRSKIQLKKAK